MKRLFLVGILLAALPTVADLVLQQYPQAGTSLNYEVQSQPSLMNSGMGIYFFKLDRDAGLLKGNITFLCSQVSQMYAVPRAYVFSEDGFKSIDLRQGIFVDRALFKFDGSFVYNGQKGYLDSFTRAFSVLLRSGGTYYFVVHFPGAPSAGSATLVIEKPEPSQWVTTLSYLKPWIALLGLIIAALSGLTGSKEI